MQLQFFDAILLLSERRVSELADSKEATFLNRLDYLFNATRKTRKELADALGVDRSTIDCWYLRNTKNINMDTIKDICTYFNIEVMYFFKDCSIDNLNILYTEYLTKQDNKNSLDLSEFSDDEKQELMNYISYLRSKRNK